jgi:hypothetical protein
MLTADDKLEILDLIHRYNWLADLRDVPGTLAEYADGGAIEGDFSAGPGGAFASELEGVFAMEGTLKRHVAANVRFLDGDASRAAVEYVLVVFEGESAPGVGATSVVRDELRREGGRWKVYRHRVRIDPSLRNALVAHGVLPPS